MKTTAKIIKTLENAIGPYNILYWGIAWRSGQLSDGTDVEPAIPLLVPGWVITWEF